MGAVRRRRHPRSGVPVSGFTVTGAGGLGGGEAPEAVAGEVVELLAEVLAPQLDGDQVRPPRVAAGRQPGPSVRSAWPSTTSASRRGAAGGRGPGRGGARPIRQDQDQALEADRESAGRHVPARAACPPSDRSALRQRWTMGRPATSSRRSSPCSSPCRAPAWGRRRPACRPAVAAGGPDDRGEPVEGLASLRPEPCDAQGLERGLALLQRGQQLLEARDGRRVVAGLAELAHHAVRRRSCPACRR